MSQTIKLLKESQIILRDEVKLYGRKFFGCEVCWTCSWFDHGVLECFLLPQYILIDKRGLADPGWYRCRYWSKRDE